jgi:hypothetical protein
LPRGRTRSAAICAVLTALALTLSACATSQKQLSVETVGAAHGDTSPRSPSRLAPGTLLSAVPITTAAALPGAAITYSVRYVSSDDSGNRIVVTGLISLPRGSAPRAGWPVLSWAHGTTGVIPACQPSQDTATGMDHDYLGRIDLTLTSWVNQGYVVAQTDYASYNGIQPYLDGTVEANNVIDIVQAARQLSRHVGHTWFVAGHSQGGQASLFTAAFAQARAPRLKFLGAVAMAPASHTGEIVSALLANIPGAAAGLPFIPVILLGASAADPAVQPSQLLTPAGMQLLAQAQTGCIGQLRAYVVAQNLTIPEVLNTASPDWATLQSWLAKQEPADYPPTAPVFIAQGSADTQVAEVFTNSLATSLCASGTPLDYYIYISVNHRGSVEASFVDYSNWLQQLLNGAAPPSTCSTGPVVQNSP